MRALYLTKNCDRPEAAMIIGLRDRGVEVLVMADERSPHVRRLQRAGIEVRHRCWEKKLDRTALREIREAISRRGIDIVHAFTHRTVLHMVLATRGLPVRLVAYRGVIGNVSWWSPLSWVRFLNPRIDRIICVAEAIRQHLLALRLLGLRLSPDKVVTIYKGHRLEWYRDQPADLGEFGIPGDAMVVTCASRLRRTKGLWELVQALGRIPPEKNVHLLFLGHEGNDALRGEIGRIPHPERVHFGGFRRDAPAIMAASHVCALPSEKEGLSRAVIEAMAYSVPAIVSDAGGNPELVVDGETGLVVPIRDPVALAEAIERLHDDPDLRGRMGRAARARLEQRFRNETTVENTLSLYRDVIAGARP